MKPLIKWCVVDYNGKEINLRLFFDNSTMGQDVWLGTQDEEYAREFWLKYNEFQYEACPFLPKALSAAVARVEGEGGG